MQGNYLQSQHLFVEGMNEQCELILGVKISRFDECFLGNQISFKDDKGNVARRLILGNMKIVSKKRKTAQDRH